MSDDGWLDLKEAPLNETGHLWSPDYPQDVHNTGWIYEYDSGERATSGSARGIKFTKWHAFPKPPAAP